MVLSGRAPPAAPRGPYGAPYYSPWPTQRNASSRRPDDITSEDDIRRNNIKGDWKGGHIGEVADVDIEIDADVAGGAWNARVSSKGHRKVLGGRRVAVPRNTWDIGCDVM